MCLVAAARAAAAAPTCLTVCGLQAAKEARGAALIVAAVYQSVACQVAAVRLHCLGDCPTGSALMMEWVVLPAAAQVLGTTRPRSTATTSLHLPPWLPTLLEQLHQQQQVPVMAAARRAQLLLLLARVWRSPRHVLLQLQAVAAAAEVVLLMLPVECMGWGRAARAEPQSTTKTGSLVLVGHPL